MPCLYESFAGNLGEVDRMCPALILLSEEPETYLEWMKSCASCTKQLNLAVSTRVTTAEEQGADSILHRRLFGWTSWVRLICAERTLNFK
jgi:hypothetical protein